MNNKSTLNRLKQKQRIKDRLLLWTTCLGFCLSASPGSTQAQDMSDKINVRIGNQQSLAEMLSQIDQQHFIIFLF
jgi:hypothetical protein